MARYYALDEDNLPYPVASPLVRDGRMADRDTIVCRTAIFTKSEVITDFLGWANDFDSRGNPYLWQTKIKLYVEDNNGISDWLNHEANYTNYDAAAEGHNAIVRNIEAEKRLYVESRKLNDK